jgi:hypothetical protein
MVKADLAAAVSLLTDITKILIYLRIEGYGPVRKLLLRRGRVRARVKR